MCCIAAMSTSDLRTDMVRARIEPRRKQRAEAILSRLGIQPSQAINMLYAQIELLKALPFESSIPNRQTLAAMKDAREGRVRKAKNAAELFEDLDR
jgi:DNA-damage-inducible protein J